MIKKLRNQLYAPKVGARGRKKNTVSLKGLVVSVDVTTR
jgi:hypothetical protein